MYPRAAASTNVPRTRTAGCPFPRSVRRQQQCACVHSRHLWWDWPRPGRSLLAGCGSSGGGSERQQRPGSRQPARRDRRPAPASAGGTVKIGFDGPLSGDNAQLGINEVNAVELAVKEANDNNTYGFKVELVKSDDVGDPAKAPAAATQLQQDPAILGVIGPSFSGATLAVGASYDQAGLRADQSVGDQPDAERPGLQVLPPHRPAGLARGQGGRRLAGRPGQERLRRGRPARLRQGRGRRRPGRAEGQEHQDRA